MPAVNKIHMLLQVSSGGGGTTSGGKVNCHLRNVSGGLHHEEVKKSQTQASHHKKVSWVAVLWGDSGRVILMTRQNKGLTGPENTR